MARLGRGTPVRPAISRTRLANFDATATMGEFALPFRFPRDKTATMAEFSLPFVFPPIMVTAPHVPGSLITQDGEVEWNATLWSPSNVFKPIDLQGWDSLSLDNGNVVRAGRHGAWPGRKLAGERIVTATVQIVDNATFTTSLKAMRATWAPPDDATEYPLAIRTRSEVLIAYGNILKADATPDYYGVGISNVTIQWACSDPRRFGTDFNSTTITTSGSMTNLGDAPASPRFRFFGPVTTPRITLAGRTLAFNIAVNSGERLDVDCGTGDVSVANTSGTVISTNYVPLDAFSAPIESITLPGGTSTLTYSPDAGGTGGLTAFWRSSYW